MANFAETARAFADAFETATRDNGDEFTKLRKGAPDWMREAILKAHGDMMPDDYCYRMARQAADSIADRADDEEVGDIGDDLHQTADAMVSVYHAARFAWLAGHIGRAAFCDEAVTEGSVAADASISDRIAAGWYAEAESIRPRHICGDRSRGGCRRGLNPIGDLAHAKADAELLAMRQAAMEAAARAIGERRKRAAIGERARVAAKAARSARRQLATVTRERDEARSAARHDGQVRAVDWSRLFGERDAANRRAAIAESALADAVKAGERVADKLGELSGRAIRAENALRALEARQARAGQPYRMSAASVTFAA